MINYIVVVFLNITGLSLIGKTFVKGSIRNPDGANTTILLLSAGLVEFSSFILIFLGNGIV